MSSGGRKTKEPKHDNKTRLMARYAIWRITLVLIMIILFRNSEFENKNRIINIITNEVLFCFQVGGLTTVKSCLSFRFFLQLPILVDNQMEAVIICVGMIMVEVSVSVEMDLVSHGMVGLVLVLV